MRRTLPALWRFKRSLKSRFEFSAIDEPCQDIVSGVVTQAPVQFTRFADVMKDQHAAGNLTFAVAYG